MVIDTWCLEHRIESCLSYRHREKEGEGEGRKGEKEREKEKEMGG